jgi:integrase/recombinase XerD
MMTQLRQRMLEELQLRNYCAGTIRLYLHHVAAFAEHFHRSSDQLGAEEIRRYQLFLIHDTQWLYCSTRSRA